MAVVVVACAKGVEMKSVAWKKKGYNFYYEGWPNKKC